MPHGYNLRPRKPEVARRDALLCACYTHLSPDVLRYILLLRLHTLGFCEGDYSFLLVSLVNDSRGRVRVDGWRVVHGIL